MRQYVHQLTAASAATAHTEALAAHAKRRNEGPRPGAAREGERLHPFHVPDLRIFQRLGLEYVIVNADNGLMGGARSEEFLHPTPVGEDVHKRD